MAKLLSRNALRSVQTRVSVQKSINPLTQMFVPDVPVTGFPLRTAHFGSMKAANASPLALRLLRIKGVKEVSFGEGFVNVTKTAREVNWRELEPRIKDAICDFIASGRPLITDQKLAMAFSTTHVRSVCEAENFITAKRRLTPTEFRMIDDTFEEIVGKMDDD